MASVGRSLSPPRLRDFALSVVVPLLPPIPNTACLTQQDSPPPSQLPRIKGELEKKTLPSPSSDPPTIFEPSILPPFYRDEGRSLLRIAVSQDGGKEGGGEKQAKPGGRKERKRREGLFTTDVNWAPPPPPPPRCQPALLPFFSSPGTSFSLHPPSSCRSPVSFLGNFASARSSVRLSNCRLRLLRSSSPDFHHRIAASPPPPPKKEERWGGGRGTMASFVSPPKKKKKKKRVEAAHSRVCKSWCSVYCATARIHFFLLWWGCCNTLQRSRSRSQTSFLSRGCVVLRRRSFSHTYNTASETQKASPPPPLPPSPPRSVYSTTESSSWHEINYLCRLCLQSKTESNFKKYTRIFTAIFLGNHCRIPPRWWSFPHLPSLLPSLSAVGSRRRRRIGGRGGERTEEAKAKPPFPILLLLPLSVAALSLPFPLTSRSLTPPLLPPLFS